jgi:hypothetical protein
MPKVHIPGVGVVHFPYDMSQDDIAAHAQRLYAEAQGKEAPFTRERRDPSAPSALEAGHHPDTLMRRTEMFGKRIPNIHEIGPDDLPSDAAFLKRAPEVGGAAGMMLGGPLGAGAGAALGSLVKGQHAQGAHVPTSGDVSGAALEGGTSLALSAVPGLSRVAAQFAGPALVKNARGVSKGLSALSGVGAGVASGSPITGLGAAAATKMLTSPGAVRAVGNAATRAGEVPMHAVNKTGFGLLNVKALLQALAEDPASTVP